MDTFLNIYQLPILDINIFDTEENIIKTKYISEPSFKYGYHYEINELKKKYYSIVNLDKLNIFKNNELKLLTEKYLNNKIFSKNNENKNEDVQFSLTNEFNENKFYYLWEILIIFKLYDKNNKKLKILINQFKNENNNIIYDCISLYRKKLNEIKNKDEYYLNINQNDEFNEIYKILDNDFLNTKIETNNNLNSFDLIIGNSDVIIDNNEQNSKEQLLYQIKFKEIYHAIKHQKQKGSFILKYFDMISELSFKFICILMYFYKQVYIYKPLKSSKISSERYIICINFKFDNLEKIKKLDIINELINNMNINQEKINDKKQKIYLNDIFSNYLIPNELINILRYITIELTNNQIEMIKKNIEYIENDKYTTELLNINNKDMQFWINHFYPINNNDKNNFDKIIIDQITKTLKNMISIN